MKKLLIPILALFLFVGFKAISSRTITGLVIANSSGLPIPGVSVKSYPSKKETTTNAAGKFSLEISNGDTLLKIAYLGYETQTIKLGKGNFIKIKLKTDTKVLHEVMVIADKSAGEKKVLLSSPDLKGEVAGLKITRERKASDKEVLEKEINTDRDSRAGNPQANQLTAGEWNDLENWGFWKNLMNNQDWSTKQQHWGFYTKNRLSINLTNKEQKPLVNYTVAVVGNGQTLWKAQSNYAGNVELWPSIYGDNQSDLAIHIFAPNGQIVYEKSLPANTHELKVTLDRQAEQIKNLDVMFMVDATGSMGDEISYLKSELEDIINRLSTEDGLFTRTGMVFYRDRGDEYVVKDFDFEQDFNKVKHNLSKQYAGGGGDFEEAVDEAMEHAILQQRWTTAENATKIMFMVLDAPPHYNSAKIKSIQKSTKEAAAKGIILIPVVASGIDKDTEFLMRFLALSTNGTYVFLTDDSGIGDSHLKPTVGKYKVEHLNQLLYRLTRKYTGLKTKMTKDLPRIANRNDKK